MKKNNMVESSMKYGLRKIFRIMKLMVFLILIYVVNAFAGKAFSQTTSLTLDVKNSSIENVLLNIEEQSRFVFLYNKDIIDLKRKVNIQFKKANVEDVLKSIFDGTGVGYRIINNQIALSPNYTTQIQVIEVNGKVTDSSGLPLPGVTVVIKGTTNGTVTDSDGNYSLSNVSSTGTIKFSFVGMKNLEMSILSKTNIDVVMIKDAIGIEEVVAIGYGTMKKADLTGAVSSVKGNQLAATNTFSVAQAMQGKIPGVQITNNGDAGSSSKIRIRGLNTIGNNSPMVVVDGITAEISLDNINPSDIESIDVLKDASALSIYGLRASNGVIMVTTKKGRYGKQSLKVNLNASYGVSTVLNRLDLVSPSQLVDIIDEARSNENTQLGGNYKLYDEIWPNDNWGRQRLTDWQDEMFHTGNVQDYSLSASGGSEKATYAFGISYRDQKGNLPQNFAKRYVLRGNLETKLLKDKLKVGTTFNYSIRESRESVQGQIWFADILQNAIMPENIPAYFDDGKPYQEIDPDKIAYFMPGDYYQNNAVVYSDFFNPNHNVFSSIYAELQIVNGLKIKSLLGQRYSQNFNRNYDLQSLNPQGVKANLSVNSYRKMTYSWDNTLTLDKAFGDLNFIAMVGGNLFNSASNGFTANRSGFPYGDPEALRYLDYGDASTQLNGESASNVRMASYFSRINLNYKEKYLLTVTVRRDGSSRFYKDFRWGTFPSFSAGWRISDEDFMNSISWIDFLKLRVGRGQVGNQNVGGDYAYVSSVISGYLTAWGKGGTDTVFGEDGTRATGRVIHQRGNQSVSWETTTMSNVGADFAVKGFNGSFELFKNNTTDILVGAQFPQIAGYFPGTSQKVNAGEVETKGFEFNVNYSHGRGDFSYNLGLNYTYSVNEIVSLDDQEFIQGSTVEWKGIAYPMSRSYVGDPIGAFYGWQTKGIFNSQSEVDVMNQKARNIAKEQNPALTDEDLQGIYYISANTAPGDYLFEDVNNDGVITAEDKKYLGCGNPKLQLGLSFEANYKNFDFALGLTGIFGVQIYSMIEPGLLYTKGFNSLTSILDHWTPDNKTDNNPRLTMSDPNKNLRASNRWIHDGAYVRFQNVILGYALPKRVVNKLGIGGLRVYGNVQNLFTITNYPFMDPEVQGTNQMGGNVDNTAGVDVGNSPNPRTILLGMNINF